jgi:hypothetical protein
MADDDDQCAVMVLERGATWPPEFRAREPAHRVIITQTATESTDELMARMVRRLGALGSEQLSVAVLACNEADDDETARARALVADVLAERLRQAGRGRLVVAASAQASARLRAELRALTADATEKLQGAGGNVKLSFGAGDSVPPAASS